MKRTEFLQKYAHPGRLLDLGCGSYFLSAGLAGEYELYPADRDVYLYDKFVRCEAFNVPYTDGYFDTVFAGELIEHNCNPGLLLAEINRLLRWGGRAIITTPNPYSFERMKNSLLGRDTLGNYDHYILFSPSSIEKLMIRYGFSIVGMGYKGLPRIGAHILACAEKVSESPAVPGLRRVEGK